MAPSSPALRRRLFPVPVWLPLWAQNGSQYAVTPSSMPLPGAKAAKLSPQRLAEVEHQAALLFMVASASTVALRAASGLITTDWLASCCMMAVAYVYLISAAVYWDLHKLMGSDSMHWTESWAERLNLGTGAASLVISLLNFWNSVPWLVTSLLYAEWLLSLLLLVDSWLYFECWMRRTGKSPWSLSSISDVSFLANWLNVIPAVLYVLASLLGVIGSKFQNEVNLFDSPIEDSRGTLLAASEAIWFLDSVLFYRAVLQTLRQHALAPKHDGFDV